MFHLRELVEESRINRSFNKENREVQYTREEKLVITYCYNLDDIVLKDFYLLTCESSFFLYVLTVVS